MNSGLLRRFRSPMVVALLASLFLFGCTHKDMKQSQSDLALKKDIDLGLILDTTAPVELYIPIKNISSRVINILSLAKDCSCISIKIDKRKLEPGETATLRYSANIFGKTDEFASDIVIESDASERFDEIQIRGQITGQIRIRPTFVTVLTGEQDSPGTFTVFCEDQDGKWNYTGFESANRSLRVDLRHESSSPTTSTYNGTITLASDWVKSLKGNYSSLGVTLKFRNERYGRDLKVVLPVEIAVRRVISIDPPGVTFLATNDEQKRTLLVQSAQVLAIDTVRCSFPSIAAAIRRLNPKSIAVDLVYHPGLGDGKFPENVECDLISDGKAIRSVPISIVSISLETHLSP